LLLYKYGGVYLDIKSSLAKPLDDILQPYDSYILCNWDNQKGGKHEGFGLHKEVSAIDGGELQQWHIISAPGSPFLRAVIDTVLTNIDLYRPWLHGVGKMGVLRVTGPIPYTLAISPLRSKYAHRYERNNEALGLIYSALNSEHKNIFKNHYSLQTYPVITSNRMDPFWNLVFSIYKKYMRIHSR
jgi:mannosyltransferase OCH1-like enzyme